MKTAVRIGTLMIAFLTLFAATASAHYLGYRWPTCNTAVPFNVSFNSTWKAQIQSAMNSWNAVNACNTLSIAGAGTTTSNDMLAVSDSTITNVAWMTPTDTYKVFGPNELTATDITFNLAYTYSITPTAGQWDIQSVAAHELGHAIGLDHNDDTPACSTTDSTTWATCATMGANWGSGITDPRSLEAHDKADKKGRY